MYSAGEEGPEVSGHSVNQQETDAVSELTAEGNSWRDDLDQSMRKYTEEYPLEPVVMYSAGEELVVSDRSFNHQETHVVRQLSGEGRSLRNDQDQNVEKYIGHKIVRSIPHAVELLRSQYDAGEIDPENVIKKLDDIYRINIVSYLTVSFSLILLIADIVSDISVGILYLTKGEWVYGVFTLGVVLTAALVPQAMYWNTSLWQKHRGDKWFCLWIGPYIAFNMEPGHLYVRNWQRVGQIITYKEQKNIVKLLPCWQKFVDEYCNVADRKQWEVQLEAGPQMILQLYILLHTSTSLSLDFTTVLQLLALVTSLLGLIATEFTGYKAECLEYARRIHSCPAVLLALGESFPIGCRAVSVAAIMSVRPVWGGLALGCHCLAIIGWMWYTGRPGVVVAAVAGLTFILAPPLVILQTATVGHALWWIEDIVMLALWWTVTDFPAALTLLCVTLAVDLVFRIVLCILRFNSEKLYEQIRL